MKQFSIIVGFLFVFAIDAQYYSTIPCKTDLTCKEVLDLNQEIRCVNGICMCANASTRSFEFCTNRDFMTGATHRDAGKKVRNCSEDADCASITGAKCYQEPIGGQKVCDCQPSHVLSSSGEHCLSTATELLSPCNETVQCSSKLGGAECAEGRCRCRPNFHYAASKKRCIDNKVFGDSCVREEESCFQLFEGKNALGCSDRNVCKCLKHYSFIDGQCQHSDASQTVVQMSLVMVMVIVATRIL